jgi:methyl coenzyme M reductase subunit D
MSSADVEPEIEIMPKRLMPEKKAEDVIQLVKGVEGVSDVLVQTYNYHGGGLIVGRFIVRVISKSKVDEILNKLKPLLEQTMPFGYDVRIGRFTKTKPSLKDLVSGKTPR